MLLSGVGDEQLSRWSYAALEPVAATANVRDATRIMSTWSSVRPLGSGPLPRFTGGAVGYVSYDAGAALSGKLQGGKRIPRADPMGMPSAYFALYDAVIARNERTHEGYILAQPGPEARHRSDRLYRALMDPHHLQHGYLAAPLVPGISRSTHLERIEHALELIRDGEIYQVNLTYPLEGRFVGEPEAAFLRLAASPPPPFAAFLRVGSGQALVSASPECFFDFDAQSRRIRTYPIKGTRAANASEPARDREIIEDLLKDEKERAEHHMIVDLLRNDVGRIAEFGSVAVPHLCYAESFPGIHHLTSQIESRVLSGLSLEDILAALFPGGSITGAPKLRSMEVIDLLEAAPRGVYTGTIGYICPDGSMRTSIAIRTAQIVDGSVRFGVGGGIVADSVPEREWDETVLKAQALSKALVG